MPRNTLSKQSLATLHPVENRGTSIWWNGHNFINNICIRLEFGTMNIRLMPNPKPMKLWKIYEVLLYAYCTGSLHCAKCGVYYKNRSYFVSFSGFKRKHLFKINLVHGNTDNISHVLILACPGMTSSLTSYGSPNDNTQRLFLKFVSCTSFDTKVAHFKHRRKILIATQ